MGTNKIMLLLINQIKNAKKYYCKITRICKIRYLNLKKKTREERHPPLNLTLNLTKYKHEHK